MSDDPDVIETDLGLGSGGRYSDPEAPVCAGCDEAIVGEPPVWEAGAQWHAACIPPLGGDR